MLTALINYRDYHGDTHSNGWEMNVERIERGMCITANANARRLYLLSDALQEPLGDRATATPAHNWHCRGTRYNIHLDARDGLLYAGKTGVQLTWMDAKVDDWVVTPRIGKPIEINALWYCALRSMARFARELGKPYKEYEAIEL